MKTKFFTLCIVIGSIGIASHAAAQNAIVTYQGRITDNGTNFTGIGQFEFALVTSTNISSQAIVTAVMANSPPNEYVSGFNIVAHGSGYSSAPPVTITGGGGSGASATSSIFLGVVNGITLVSPGSGYSSTPTVTLSAPGPDIFYTGYWGNDGGVGDTEPSTYVPVSVNDGLFTVGLGDTTLSNMAPISASLFEQPNLQLVIWFNDGVNGFAMLTPVQNLTASPYSAFADTASNITGSITTTQLPSNIIVTGLISGNGNGLSNLNATQLAGSFNGTLTLPAVSNVRTDMVLAGASPLVYSDYNGNGFTALAGNTTTSGEGNTASGSSALSANGKGSFNTAFGDEALYLTPSGSENTAIGYSALYSLGFVSTKGGTNNIALGYTAGSSYTGNESSNIDIGNVGKLGESNVIHIGTSQTATSIAGVINGNGGGVSNLSAAFLTGTANVLNVKGGLAGGLDILDTPNIISGWDGYLLYSDTSNNFFADSAAGESTLTTANNNIAVGPEAMYFVISASNNVSIGNQSMYNNNYGVGNVAIGSGTLYGISYGFSNIAIGYYAGSAFEEDESDNIDIGNNGQQGDNETIRIGTSQTEAYIAGVINGNGSGLTGVGLLSSPNAFTAANTIVDTTTSDIALNVGGYRTGNYNSPVTLIQNLSTASGVSPALRLGVGPGSSPSGALSVSAGAAAGTANSIIAQFGNSSAFVLVITNDGSLYSAGSVYAAGVKLTSDRNAKENFAPLNVNEVLDKVAALPLSEWNYTNESVGSRHIGPMAQDFHSAFGLDGDDVTHISVVDEGGVALAAIQGLNQKLAQTQKAVKDKDAEIQSLKQQNDSLAARLNELETAVKSLQARGH